MRVFTIALLSLAVVACSGRAEKQRTHDASDISIGYGTRARAELTGAVTSIRSEDTRGFRYARIEDMLAARVPGLEVRRGVHGTSLRMRGTNTLVGNSAPLIVIDGVPTRQHLMTQVLASINPNDVERIDVLRDAASTAIYGSRGANGVILIRTRLGGD